MAHIAMQIPFVLPACQMVIVTMGSAQKNTFVLNVLMTRTVLMKVNLTAMPTTPVWNALLMPSALKESATLNSV